MEFDVSVAMTWLLFLALFPISFYWLRNSWQILKQRNFSGVALRRGIAPPNQEGFAPWAASINLICATVLVGVIGGVLAGGLAYQIWSAIAGSTIWLKLILDFALSRHAHMAESRKAGCAR